MITYEALKNLELHLRAVLALARNDQLNPEMRYDAVFAFHAADIVPAVQAAGLSLDWCDPDTTYEEDVAAYADAAATLHAEVVKMLPLFTASYGGQER